MTMTQEQKRKIFKAIGKALKGDGGFKDYHSVERQLYRKCPIHKGSLGELILNIIDPSWEADAKYTNGQRFDIGEEFAKANSTIFFDSWSNVTIRKEAVARLKKDAEWTHIDDGLPDEYREVWVTRSRGLLSNFVFIKGVGWMMPNCETKVKPPAYWKTKEPTPEPYSGVYGEGGK